MDEFPAWVRQLQLSEVGCSGRVRRNLLLPDRDNTFVAFVYDELGTCLLPIPPSGPVVGALAQALRDLTALNRMDHPNWDEAVAILGSRARRATGSKRGVQAKEARADFDARQSLVRCHRSRGRSDWLLQHLDGCIRREYRKCAKQSSAAFPEHRAMIASML